MNNLVKYLLASGAVLCLFGSAQVSGQSFSICDPNNRTDCAAVTSGTLQTSASGGGGGGSSSLTINQNLPTIATATAVPVGSKAGAAYVQPVFGSGTGGGAQVGLATGLPIQGAGASAQAVAVTATSMGVNINQFNGATIGTGIPVFATSLAVTSGSTDGTSKTGLQYSGIAGVAETSATSCTTATQCYVSLDPNNRALRVDNAPVTAGGLSISSNYIPASAAAIAIDASPGQIYKVEAYNNNATILYLNFFDSSSGSTVCGTTGSAKYRMMVPANSTSGAGVITQDVFGLPFATAITMCPGITFGATGLPTADEYIVNIFYR